MIKTNQVTCAAGEDVCLGGCVQRRLRSAWATAQSDQSLRWPTYKHELVSMCCLSAHQIVAWMVPRLVGYFISPFYLVIGAGFVMCWLILMRVLIYAVVFFNDK